MSHYGGGYPGQGYHGSQSHHGGGGPYQGYQGGGGGGGYDRPPPPPPGGYAHHPPPPGPGYGGGGGGGGGYGGQSYGKPPPPRYAPPPGLDAYGYPLHQAGYAAHHSRAGPPPPTTPQQFGHGAPEGYTFQYSNCTGKRKALLIGINYFGQNGELRGCVNDVQNLSNFLVERFGYKREDMVLLTDDQRNPVMQPTKQNIIRAMGWLVNGAQPNDSLFLHYSGTSLSLSSVPPLNTDLRSRSRWSN